MTSAPKVPADDIDLPIYPTYCHRLSPTLGKWCPMLARDVVALSEVVGFEGQDIYFYLNHPIKYIKLTGVVITMDEYPVGKNGRMVVITLDDGSGVNIGCACSAPPKMPLSLPAAYPSVSANEKDETRKNRANSLMQIKSEKDTEAVVKEGVKDRQCPDRPNLVGVDIGTVVKAKGGIQVFRGSRQISLKRIQVLRETNKEVLAWTEIVAFHREVLSGPWVVGKEEEEKCRNEKLIEDSWKRREEEKYGQGSKMGGNETGAKRFRRLEPSGIDREKGIEMLRRRSVENGLSQENRAYLFTAARKRAAGQYEALANRCLRNIAL